MLVGWVSYRRHPANFLMLWMTCWGSYLIARLVTVVQLGAFKDSFGVAGRTIMSISAQTFFYMHVVLMLGCMLALLRRGQEWLRPRVLLGCLLGIAVICTIITLGTSESSSGFRLVMRVSLRCALTAAAYLVCGVLLLRHGRNIGRFGAQFAAYAMFVQVLYLSTQSLAFSVGGDYAMAAYLQGLEILGVCAIGFGLLLWVQQDASDDAAQANRALGARTSELLRAQRLESVGQLAGGVAHDFNNVLTVVMCNTEMMLADKSIDGEARTTLEQTQHAAMHAAKMTSQLLALARNPASALRSIDVAREAIELLPLLRCLAGGSVNIELDVSPGSLRARLKRGHVEQVMINLVTNGRDAIAECGTIRLSVRRQVGPNGARIVLIATDSGQGMAEAVKARVGELFFTTKPGTGTGMGMASVRSILSETDGLLHIESDAADGTTVTVSWPQAEASTESFVIPALPAVEQPQSATVLLAEDDDVVRAIAERALTRAGYHVVSGHSSLEAARLAREYPGAIDILVSDVVMPGMSGPELAVVVNATRPSASTCFISGFVDEDTRVQLPESVPVLGKPFTPQELVDFVGGVLAASSSAPVSDLGS
ncbi:MAG: signal transduction histidine kinase/CheY-like chemotaxis protein [Planctomycetota bacterium]|jgi:signal transduction histidine kinase/CheY-like chemotaxis protein